jgi:hypothetical protein
VPLAACRLNYVSNKDDSSDDGSRGTGYAVATFSSRTGALAAIEQLDGLPVKVSPMLSGSIAEYSTFRLRWCLKFPVLRLLDLSPELRHEDLYQVQYGLWVFASDVWTGESFAQTVAVGKHL